MTIRINEIPNITKNDFPGYYTPFIWNNWELSRTSQGQNLGSTEFKHCAAFKFI